VIDFTTLREIDAEFKTLSRLPFDWNGYGAVQISSFRIEDARRFVANYSELFPSRPTIVPMTRGQLWLEWSQGYRRLEFRFNLPYMVTYLKWPGGLIGSEERIIPINDQCCVIDLFKWFTSPT
jgi:hypothetical protein